MWVCFRKKDVTVILNKKIEKKNCKEPGHLKGISVSSRGARK